MTDPKDSKLDVLLSGHLRAELDPQLGRANARFDQMIRMQQQFAAASADQAQHRAAPRRLHVNRFMLGIIGTAIAAAVAGVMIFSPTERVVPGAGFGKDPVVVSQGNLGSSSMTSEPEPGIVAVDAIPVQRDVAWRTLDRGTVFVGEEEQPMRQLVRQRVDNYRWTDPDSKFNVEYSVPNDEVMLVGLKCY